MNRVTPNDWHQVCEGGEVVDRTPTDLNRQERFASVVLAKPDPTYKVTQSPNNAWPQYVGMGYIRASIAALPLAQLQDMTGYLLKHRLIRTPQHYENYDMLKQDGGGADILLNELLHESDDTLLKGFLTLGRLKPGHQKFTSNSTATKRAKKQKQRATADGSADNDGAALGDDTSINRDGNHHATIPNDDGAEFDNASYPMTVPDFPKSSRLNATWYVGIPTDGTGVLQANIGQPYNDSQVYVRYPTRSLFGRYDGVPDQTVGLCGPQMNNWMQQTAHETLRNPKFKEFADRRDELADYKRRLCPVGPNDVGYAANMVREGVPLDKPAPLTAQAIRDLKQIGWTDAEMQKMGYL
jgi:hypothetical protein